MFLKKVYYKTYSLINDTQKFDTFLSDKNVKLRRSFLYNYLFFNYNTNVFPFNTMEESINWLNAQPLELRQLLSQLGKQSYGIGEGETILKIINKITPKSSLAEFDISIKDELWEVKKGQPILSGGTHKQPLNDFITVLTLFDKLIRANKYLPTFLKYKQTQLQEDWINTFKHRDSDKVSFANISLTKWNKFFGIGGLLQQLNDFHSTLICDSMFSGHQLFTELNFIFNFINEHNIFQRNLENMFKVEFFENLTGLIWIDSFYQYHIINQQEFMRNWHFAGITKANRLQFKV